jgi:hypothetical protein
MSQEIEDTNKNFIDGNKIFILYYTLSYYKLILVIFIDLKLSNSIKKF